MEKHNLIKISSSNVRGLHDVQKRKDVFGYLRNKKFHICCLQDTHFTESLEPYIRAEWGGEAIFSSFSSSQRGVCILFSNDFEYKVLKVKKDIQGNYIILELEIEGKKVTLINLYGPNEDSPDFFTKIAEKIEELETDTCIWCGDFNLVQDQELDTYNYLHINNPKAKECVLNLKEELNLVDPFREMFETDRRYTWRKPTPLKQARLDFFLVSEIFMTSVENIDILPSYRSDHSTVVLSLKLNEFTKGKGLWKFNNSLLKDIEYAKLIRDCIQHTKEQYMIPVYNIEYIRNNENFPIQMKISDQLFLETLLIIIRGKTISYSAFKKKQNNLREENLQKEIKLLEEEEVLDVEKIEDCKNELEKLRKEKLNGIMVRARIRWAEEGEKPTKYFCSLESRNYVNKIIPSVHKEDGTVINKQSEILQEVKNFYSNLFAYQDKDQDLNIEHILNNLNNHPTLTAEEKSNLEGEISEEEIAFILSKMKNNKSPGTDGFSAEFFKFFFKDLKVFIKNSINEGYKLGILSVTQREGLITCLPKGDKPRQFLKNWRPITLLNVVYKIASGCIAERIKSTLSKLISNDQTGFISGRYIGENTRLIYDLMNYTEEENIPGLLLIIDFEKAFDSISWRFIFQVLKYFNFSESIIRWISVFYENISSAVIQSGFLSDFFPVQRGCRQGDPLSPYIFILCAEVLSLMIKSNKDIKGININGMDYNLTQFADDTTIFLDGTEKSLQETMDTLSLFAHLSGLKINTSKTKAVWIGAKKFSGETFNHRYKFDWQQNNFTILGIKFSCNLDNMLNLNFKEKLIQIEKELKQWSKRILTPFGRITILKSLIISKLNHLFISLPNPTDETINKLQRSFFQFIWQSGTDRIKREVLMQSYENGGLKMINIRNYITALKSTWIRRLLKCDHKYKYIFETKYSKTETLVNRGTEFIHSVKANKTNRFWNDVLESWATLQYKMKPLHNSDILGTNIWDNKNIRIDNKPIFYQRWYDKKIYFIKDMLNVDGKFLNLNNFIEKYDLNINFLEYMSVRSAVESYIKNNKFDITNSILTNCYLPFSITQILKREKGSKDIYRILNEKNIITKSQQKWEREFQDIELKWKVLYSIPAYCCSNTKLHWFQYRILHRILATNNLLWKYKIKRDNLCSFCKKFPETLEHLFWYCDEVQDFWEKIETWIAEKSEFVVNINEYGAIFGKNNKNCNKPENYILILTRYYIYKSRINNTKLYLNIWKREVKCFIETEKMIAIKNSKYDKFYKEWEGWLGLFDD